MKTSENFDLSIFDIVGPVMIGPSSSGTAGMMRIGSAARLFLEEEPSFVEIVFHERNLDHYEGCCSHLALLSGLMGFATDDCRVPDALSEAKKRGLSFRISFFPKEESPDMLRVKLHIKTVSGKEHAFTAVSTGGGSIRVESIEGFPVSLSNYEPHLFLTAAPAVSVEDLIFLQKKLEELIGVTFFLSTKDCHGLLYCPWKRPIPEELKQHREMFPDIMEVKVIPAFFEGGSAGTPPLFTEFSELLSLCEKENCTIAEMMVRYEMKRSGMAREVIYDRMRGMWEICKKAVKEGLTGEYHPIFGLDDGKNAKRMLHAYREGKTLGGSILPKVSAYTLAVMEYAVSMGCIAATPTCGSAGVVPGCLFALQEEYGFSDEEMVRALFTMTSLGIVMAYDGVRFSGCAAGCQGEMTVSAAMAAMGIACLGKASAKQIGDAAAFTIKGLLGLVCDPVMGVEVPCIKRNVSASAAALSAADMAISGIESCLSTDEASLALKDVQDHLPEYLRGGGGGCAHVCHAGH